MGKTLARLHFTTYSAILKGEPGDVTSTVTGSDHTLSRKDKRHG